MIIKDLVQRVSKVLQDFTPETQEDILQWIFDCKEDMLRMHDFESLKRKHTASADGSTIYVLPSDFRSMIKCVAGENKYVIPNYLSNIAANLRFRIINGYTIGEIVSVESTEVGDTSQVVAVYEDRLVSEVLTLTGLTPVLSSGSFAEIMYIYKDETAGQVILKRQSGATILTLPKNKLNYTIKSIEFSAALTNGDIVIWYMPIVEKLTGDYDVDEFQVKFADVIIEYCLYRGFGDQDNAGLETKHYGRYNELLVKAIRNDRRDRNRNVSATITPVRYPGG